MGGAVPHHTAYKLLCFPYELRILEYLVVIDKYCQIRTQYVGNKKAQIADIGITPELQQGNIFIHAPILQQAIYLSQMGRGEQLYIHTSSLGSFFDNTSYLLLNPVLNIPCSGRSDHHHLEILIFQHIQAL